MPVYFITLLGFIGSNLICLFLFRMHVHPVAFVVMVPVLLILNSFWHRKFGVSFKTMLALVFSIAPIYGSVQYVFLRLLYLEKFSAGFFKLPLNYDGIFTSTLVSVFVFILFTLFSGSLLLMLYFKKARNNA